MMPGGVFRIGMPRTDLKVTVEDVPVLSGFALGSYAAFKKYDDGTMVMGDLVLLDQEVNGVMSGLLDRGFQVTALHNHLNNMSPHVMYMHYEGHGDALQSVLRDVFVCVTPDLSHVASVGGAPTPLDQTDRCPPPQPRPVQPTTTPP